MYGSTTTTVPIWSSATAVSSYIVYGTIPYPGPNDGPMYGDVPDGAPRTKAEEFRLAMRAFLGSLHPSYHFRAPPPLRPRPPAMHQMVHRRRCQSLGPRRVPRFSRA
jgi:hypothetical protein